jgi:hypothetical protein
VAREQHRGHRTRSRSESRSSRSRR